jgi:predicted nucleic acid-binding protein
VTSVPVVIETFTYLDRKGSRELALAWRDALAKTARLAVLSCGEAELQRASTWLDRRDLHRLSLTDATSFVLMTQHKIRAAFAFDTHFATAGFRLIG